MSPNPKRLKASVKYSSPGQQYGSAPMYPTPPPVQVDAARSSVPMQRFFAGNRVFGIDDSSAFNEVSTSQPQHATVDEKDVKLLQKYLTGKFNIE
jgi:hypothetical protein